MNKGLNKLMLLAGVFFASLLVSNVVGFKLFVWRGLMVTVGVLFYPVTFAVTDTISEVWGKRTASMIVRVGFLLNVLLLFFIWAARALPAAPGWQYEREFDMVLGAVPRITFASLCAYIVSQSHDVWAFHWWKQLTKGKHLWIRNNASTLVSQFIDTSIYMLVAFGGSMPFSGIVALVISEYLIKAVLALLDTPIVYGLVNWARKN